MPENPENEGSRLITLKQIELEHGVSRSALHTYRLSSTFPQPVPVEGSTKTLYEADAVAAWFQANPKQQGKKRDRFVSQQQGDPDMAEQTLTIGEPTPSNDRGLLLYGGRDIPTDYGHVVRVQESSSAKGPHVWLVVDSEEATTGSGHPHLSLEQAIAVHAALGQFIESVPERWEDGAELLAEARRRVLGGSSGDEE